MLTLVSLTQDAASELLYPLLPILITGLLAAPPVVLGVIEGLADATAGAARYVAGRWSDRRGRRPFIAAGYTLAAGGKALVAAATGWPMVLAGRVVDRFGKGIRSAPRDALIAMSTPADLRGRAFGFHRAGDTLGAVIGPLLGLAALEATDGDVRAAMWWAIVPAVTSALLVALVRDHFPTPSAPEPPPAGPAPTVAPAAVTPAAVTPAAVPPATGPRPTPSLPRRFRVVVAVLATIAVLNFSDALVLLRVKELGLSTTGIVLAYVVFNSVYTLGSYPAGVLGDRWPRPVVYAVGLSAFAVGYVGLGLTGGGPTVYVLVAVYGLFPAFTDGVGKAWIASLVPDGLHGRAQGVFQAFNNGAVLVAGLWAGLLWGVGPGAGVVPLVASGIGAAAAAVVMVACRSRLDPA